MKHISQQRKKYRKPGSHKNNNFTLGLRDAYRPPPGIKPGGISAFSFFDGMLNSLSDLPIFVIDSTFVIVYLNQTCQKFLYNHNYPEQAAGKHLDTSVPFINQEVIELIKNSFQTGEPVKKEVCGSYKFVGKKVEISLNPFIDSDDKRFITLVLKDVSAQTSEKLIPDRNQQLQAEPGDFILVKDMHNRIIHVNQSMMQALNICSLSEIIGKSEKELEKICYHKAQAENVKEKSVRDDLLHLTGSLSMQTKKEIPLIGKEGQMVAILCIYHDKQTGASTKRVNDDKGNRFRTLIENQNAGLGIIDEYNRFTFANKACGELFHCNSDELIGQSMNDFLSPSNKAKMEIENEKRRTGLSGSFHLQIRLKNGQKRHVIVSATPYQEKSSFKGSFIIFRDITSEKLAEKRLRQSESQLRHLNATKDKMFSIIAHDLKNPFGSIMGFSNLILKKLKEKDIENSTKYTEIIHDASFNGFKLLENLLTWTKAQSGTLKYSPDIISITHLVEHNISVCHSNAEAKSIHLYSKIKDNFLVYIDEDMINTVLRNLINNAIKFTPNGKDVFLEAGFYNSDWVSVSVIDEGIGIAPADTKKLFKTNHNFTTKGTNGEEGTGLGLLLCKEFVEKNQGKIWVESAPGQGSRFSFSIPVA